MTEPTKPHEPTKPIPSATHSPNTPKLQDSPRKKDKGYTAGMMTTYGGTEDNDPRGDRTLTFDEIHSLAGDMAPGDVGWLKLDDEGNPTGPALRELPPPGDGNYARVIGAFTHKYDEITTPSGAPVTKFMNPEPTLGDEGMRLRNPVPKETQAEHDKHKTSAGQPVINKPGTV